MTRSAPIPPSTFGQRLKRARHAAGLTITELSKRAGLSRTSLYAFEKGEVTARLGNAVALAESLDVDTRWLCFGEGEEQPKPKTLLPRDTRHSSPRR